MFEPVLDTERSTVLIGLFPVSNFHAQPASHAGSKQHVSKCDYHEQLSEVVLLVPHGPVLPWKLELKAQI